MKKVIELYHVSCKDYKNGTVICSDDFVETEYYQNSKVKNQDWIDETLDQNRPNGFPERKNPKACPMCLTDALSQNDENLNKKVSKEYWAPEKDWKFLEYLSTEMKVIEKVSEPDIMTKVAGQNNYQCDFEQKKNIKY